MLKSIVFGSFYHPFQDGYKSSVKQILFPWLVQGKILHGSFLNNCGTNFGSFYHPERVVQEIKYFRNRMLG